MPGQIKSAGAASAAGEVGLVRARCLACFRPLGNLQRRVLRLPRPRKRSAARFDAFRGLGNVQRRVLTFSDPSETLKQPVKPSDSSGRLRGGRQQRFSGTRPDFAGGRSRPDASEGGTNIHDKVFPAHPAYLCRRLSGIGMRCERSDTMSDYYLLLRDYSNYYL